MKAKLERRNVKAKVDDVSDAAPDHSEGGSKDELDSKEKVKFFRVLVRIRHCLVSIHLQSYNIDPADRENDTQ